MEYRRPQGIYIGNEGKLAKKLYVAEARRYRAMHEAMEIMTEILEFTDPWKETCPEMLLSVLEGWSGPAAILACEAYLQKYKGKI